MRNVEKKPLSEGRHDTSHPDRPPDGPSVAMSPRSAVLGLVFTAGCCFMCAADVGDFSPCLQVFYRSWPPKGLEGTPICQRFHNQYRFATLYSRPRRSPWFSAYLYTSPEGKRPKSFWKFEPQLADPGARGDMVPFPPGPVDQNMVDSQAVELDYINSTFSRGHLNPSLHHRSHEDRTATFTLANVVPQKAGSNDGPWKALEQAVNRTLAAHCLGAAHVVTGAIPYRGAGRWLGNRRVAVPEYLWSAYCCPEYSASLPVELRKAFPTYAAIGRNDRDSGEEIVPVSPAAKEQFRGFDVRTMTLEILEGHLGDRLGGAVRVFYEQCSGSD
ncbi:endonuclease domain-containing 1 protein-like isoform X1 [Pseudoliparis swirei]|uniref:endonuclease domain-containing 1 protein-like isoform X1 n=2 Tax=Pseudoliparis swirei TaxID=2059687 RepID=UPI0024BDF019|nr:endonuclease domain-containing 1 protein-like isoform X1 [Pseudoliparis swirei]